MVELTIKVTGADKWVYVEDMSGRGVQLNGYVKEKEPRVIDIFSTTGNPGNVVVYAGPRQNVWTAKFHRDNFNSPCTLELSDTVVASTIAMDADTKADKKSDACEWENVLKKSP